jgi:hypothetical protein
MCSESLYVQVEDLQLVRTRAEGVAQRSGRNFLKKSKFQKMIKKIFLKITDGTDGGQTHMYVGRSNYRKKGRRRSRVPKFALQRSGRSTASRSSKYRPKIFPSNDLKKRARPTGC